MNRWVQRGLRTTLLTGGLLAAGTGVATAAENDLTAGLLGATATVPVRDGTVLATPVVTGTGEDLTVTGGGETGLSVPVETNTAAGTTVLGDGGVSVPVRVTEADGSAPDPADGLTVTAPVNSSGGGTAGTTVTAPVVTGDLGDVLDGDPSSGAAVRVDLTDPVVPQRGGGVLLDLEDTVTIGDTDGTTSPDTVLELPVGLDGDRPTTVSLPLPGGAGAALPGSGAAVDVRTGGLLPGLPVGVSGTGVEVTVRVLGGGTGSGRSGLAGIGVRAVLSGREGGSGGGHGAGAGPDAGPGAGNGRAGNGRAGAGNVRPGADGRTSSARAGVDGCRATGAAGTTSGAPGRSPEAGAPSAGGSSGTGPSEGAASGSGSRSGTPSTADSCGTGSPQAVTLRASSSAMPAGAAPVGAVAVGVGLLLAAARGRLWRDRE